jgi:thiamine biosynthesis protein ThiI
MSLATPIIACAYAEIALKGRNRSLFLRKLINNMQQMLAGEPVARIEHVESRLLVHLADPDRAAAVADRLRRVFGLQWVSPVAAIPRSEVDDDLAADLAAEREPRLERVAAAATRLALAHRGEARHFKIETRRSDRGFALKSPDISRAVGHAVGEALGLPGRMVQPDLTVNVLVLKENILVFAEKILAYGGLPFASSGRSLVLLSGGIDSPVAAWLMMRRGSRPEFVHFYSGRGIEEADTRKIEELVRILAGYSPVALRLHLVPVVPYEMRAIGVIADKYDMVMFRRFMIKTAVRIARRHSCLALVTGDSLGQVASQTVHNLGAISADVPLPILRPLIGMDKLEITAWSREIGVYETSILPYRDCCSIRSPRPILNARADDLQRLSEEMSLDDAVVEAIGGTVRLKIGPHTAPATP